MTRSARSIDSRIGVENRTPASYWITNPQNTFEDNVAAGTEGTGFWFALPERRVAVRPQGVRLRPGTGGVHPPGVRTAARPQAGARCWS